MKIFDHYKKATTENYSNFTGRAGRQEIKSFVLVNTLIPALIIIASGVQHLLLQWYLKSPPTPTYYNLFFRLYLLYFIVILIPKLALYVRRAHDLNINAWSIYLSMVPLVLFFPILQIKIGSMVDYFCFAGSPHTVEPKDILFTLLVASPYITLNTIFFTKKGDSKANKYGPPLSDKS